LCVSDEFLEEHHRVLDLRLQPVVREITDSRARTRDELESLYRKIVSCILLRSGLGAATDVGVVREASGVCLAAYYNVKMLVPEQHKVTMCHLYNGALNISIVKKLSVLCTSSNQE